MLYLSNGLSNRHEIWHDDAEREFAVENLTCQKNVGRQAGMLKPVKLQNSTIFEPLDNLGEI